MRTARMRSQNTEQYSMAITFNGCGSRVVLCTWAHVFAILDPHLLALLTICCSLYFCIQVDVWHTLEDYASQGEAASRAAPCVGARRGSSPGMLDSPVGRTLYRVSSTWSCRIRTQCAGIRWGSSPGVSNSPVCCVVHRVSSTWSCRIRAACSLRYL